MNIVGIMLGGVALVAILFMVYVVMRAARFRRAGFQIGKSLNVGDDKAACREAAVMLGIAVEMVSVRRGPQGIALVLTEEAARLAASRQRSILLLEREARMFLPPWTKFVIQQESRLKGGPSAPWSTR